MPEIIPNTSNPPRSTIVTFVGKSLNNVSPYEYARIIGRMIPIRNADCLFLNITGFLKYILNPMAVKISPNSRRTIQKLIQDS